MFSGGAKSPCLTRQARHFLLVLAHPALNAHDTHVQHSAGRCGLCFARDQILKGCSMTELFEEVSVAVRSGVSSAAGEESDEPYMLPLELEVYDREVIRALIDYAEGEERNQYALEALKIGVLALRHVGGMVATDQFRQDGDRFLSGLEKALEAHRQTVQSQIEGKLKEYFDAKDGRFTDRVQRLIAHDGELSQLMKGFIDGENSLFSRTLMTQVGRDSALMKLLDPQHSDGLLSSLRKTVDEQLAGQRDHLLKEFSLDNKDGALTRFILQLTEKHGSLSEDVQKKIDVIIKEFSLNEDNSALSRLVQNVTQAQRTITNEFSLDSETSCLSKLKRELMTVLEAHVKTNAEFQEEVKLTLRELAVRKSEQARSTEHGKTFQRAMCEFVQSYLTDSGDVAEFVGDNVGAITNCKKGDVVVTLGCDTTAPGAKIVIEAKEEERYSLTKALAEIAEARKNRGAEVGVFVYSAKTVHQNLRPVKRYGNDVVVVWNAEQTESDSYLWAALEFARMTCFRSRGVDDSQAADFESIEKLLANIEKRANKLNEIRKYAETAQSSAKSIQSATTKIIKRAEIDRKSLEGYVTRLRKCVLDLRDLQGEQ
jgi:hypothetical protein